ncbi:Protein PBDC1 [Trichinella pseudospiralis]|uniref:Protein PBDC1 n=2 Tax=Trichinella pseudospiralis TaxID=6337 RepID=A0A0V1EXQ4_TRIPS|nr:Protein PBDC1 [Trichinella pseudospiralis]KRY92926.1 Protein PBDC1 [Trichinella pseudospiralis]KRZ32037.1 Protein PBDC1 [Trichinella pseudospiralis]
MVEELSNEIEKLSEAFGNDMSIENAWAMTTYDNCQLHMDILSSCNPKYLRLSRCDDEIYNAFREQFPDLKVDVVDEFDLKTKEMKEKWRNFADHFKDKVADYNFGTLLRSDSNGVYDSANTFLVPKIQFLAIEIARNRENCNQKFCCS